MLKVEGLTKVYPKFRLEDVSFVLPEGYIMGFIGMNGAGKSTTLKAMLRLVQPDAGRVEAFGKDMEGSEREIKQQLSFTPGAFEYYPLERLERVAKAYRAFYDGWDDAAFSDHLARFKLDASKRVRELSAGMKVKFALALALSHGAKLLILDEPTSGLDPVARDELLEIFQRIVEDGDKSILFSTHITSDLDKCADLILFIREGRVVADAPKDDLIAAHALIAGKRSELTDELKARLISYKENAYGFTGLIERRRLTPQDAFPLQPPNLEDIMIYYDREVK